MTGYGSNLAQSGKSLFKWRSGPVRLILLIGPLTHVMIIQLVSLKKAKHPGQGGRPRARLARAGARACQAPD
jgi:hypothetical protein